MFITSQWRKIDRAAVMPSEQHLCLISIRVPLVPDLLCQPCGGSRVPRRAQLGTVPWWLRRCPQQGEAALPGAWLRPCGCVCALAGLGNALGFGALGRAGKHTRAGIMGQPLPRCRPARSDAWGPDGLVPAPCLLFCSNLGPTGLPRAGSDADIKPGG